MSLLELWQALLVPMRVLTVPETSVRPRWQDVESLTNEPCFAPPLPPTSAVEILGWAARLWAHWAPLSFDAYVMQVRPAVRRTLGRPSEADIYVWLLIPRSAALLSHRRSTRPRCTGRAVS